jgi:hypothetical protein
MPSPGSRLIQRTGHRAGRWHHRCIEAWRGVKCADLLLLLRQRVLLPPRAISRVEISGPLKWCRLKCHRPHPRGLHLGPSPIRAPIPTRPILLPRRHTPRRRRGPLRTPIRHLRHRDAWLTAATRSRLTFAVATALPRFYVPGRAPPGCDGVCGGSIASRISSERSTRSGARYARGISRSGGNRNVAPSRTVFLT